MPDTIISDWTPDNTTPSHPVFNMLGTDFDPSTTHFCIDDVTFNGNPVPIWDPEDSAPEANSVPNNGSQGTITSAPSMPGGGALPTTGDLRISAYDFSTITPTKHGLTKPFIYTGLDVFKPRWGFPTIVDFSPIVYRYGSKITMLITGLKFDEDTIVDLNEVYAQGVVWTIERTIQIDETIIVIVASLYKLGQPIPGCGFLEVSVVGADRRIKSDVLKPVTYMAN
jgi:hypothetical protein